MWNDLAPGIARPVAAVEAVISARAFAGPALADFQSPFTWPGASPEGVAV